MKKLIAFAIVAFLFGGTLYAQTKTVEEKKIEKTEVVKEVKIEKKESKDDHRFCEPPEDTSKPVKISGASEEGKKEILVEKTIIKKEGGCCSTEEKITASDSTKSTCSDVKTTEHKETESCCSAEEKSEVKKEIKIEHSGEGMKSCCDDEKTPEKK